MILLDKSSFYTEHNTINIQKFPLELLLEALISFLSVTLGALYTYATYDEIYISSQKSEKSVKHFNKPLFNSLTSKGGMLNYYLNNKNPN